jgi:signal transduction histidine kinase
MAKATGERRLTLLFYILTTYILLQFAWWAYLLVDLNRLYFANEGSEVVNLKVWMVIGEGSVFLTFLLIGIFIMQRTIRKEINLVRQQRNFLLSITHELKTPIAAIKLGIQTLQKRKELKEEHREKIELNALTNTERLHSLIDNVLLATRIESNQHPLNKLPTNISKETIRICEETQTALGTENKIAIDVSEGVQLNVDSSAYESILVNLIENASKYSDGNRIGVSLQSSEGTVDLTVEDSGRGIPKSERNKVFNKFYRMGDEETRSKKGTGLGLFIVKELVELHEGKIKVSESSRLGGACVHITFPKSKR